MHTPSTRILSALAYDRRAGIRPDRPGLPGARRRAVAERARDARSSATTARMSGRASAGASATASGRRSRTGSRPRT